MVRLSIVPISPDDLVGTSIVYFINITDATTNDRIYAAIISKTSYQLSTVPLYRKIKITIQAYNEIGLGEASTLYGMVCKYT